MAGEPSVRAVLLHRLILLAFVGEPPPGYECCHNNDDPSDNRLENLRWDTRTQNIQDAIRHGRNWQLNKQTCPWGHPLREPNLVLSKVLVGHRKCQACALARNYARHLKDRKGIEISLDAIRAEADRRYGLLAGKIQGLLR
jgi:hypothetical protein